MQYEECEYLSEQWFKYQDRALGYAACWYYHETKIEEYVITINSDITDSVVRGRCE